MRSDDARGGLRGLRALPSEDLVEITSTAYGIGSSSDPIDLGGSSNLNLHVCDGSDCYVVRSYRPYVTADRLREIHYVRQRLSAAGIPCGGLVPTSDGRPWILFHDRLVEVERYVEHDADMDSWDRLEAGMSLLGRMHNKLRALEVGDGAKFPMFANHVSSADALDQTLRGTRRIRNWDPSPSELQLADDAEELARRVSIGEQALAEPLPRQLIHGDFWDNNVLFRNGEIVFVTDFEFMGERARIDELALTLYFTCMEFVEDPVSDEQLERLHKLIDAYDAGSDTPLRMIERAALPLAIARQPLWSIGGWVASLDDEAAARQHAASVSAAVNWALSLVRDLLRWRAALA
jgi:Ser/Thr protein kinase RdoA (MazF antagonist)